jgi:hypothetical protein
MRGKLLGLFLLAVGIVGVGLTGEGSQGPLPLGRELSPPTLAGGASADTDLGQRFASRPAPALPRPSSEQRTAWAVRSGTSESSR